MFESTWWRFEVECFRRARADSCRWLKGRYWEGVLIFLIGCVIILTVGGLESAKSQMLAGTVSGTAALAYFFVRFLWHWVLAPWRLYSEPDSVEALRLREGLSEKKFYTKRGRENVSDALDELSEILSTDGEKICAVARTLGQVWQHQVTVASYGKPFDRSSFDKIFQDIENMSVTFHRKITGSDGLFDRYSRCSSELKKVLKQQPESIRPLSDLVQKKREFAEGVTLAADVGQPLLERTLSVLCLHQNEFMRAEGAFNSWVRLTERRLSLVRATLR